MSEELVGNVLVAQSGGPTAVINASLAGVVTEALNHECIEEIYGASHGILGVLTEELIDLAEESQQNIRGLSYTPASALGSCRYKVKKQEDFDRILQVFEAHNIRYFFYIGGNDSQDTAHKVHLLAQERGYDLRAIGVPKTVDNDLAVTDHCPGYGSVIKYVATAVRELSQDHKAMSFGNPMVSIVEVMGRNAGWIAAGSSLAKRKNHPEDAPHIVLMPEVAFNVEKFIADVQTATSKYGYCLVVVGEGLVDETGNFVATQSETKDDFGHANLGGVGDYLKSLIEQHLAVKVISTRLGHHQRSAASQASLADNEEAFGAGAFAVESAINGESGKTVILTRGDADEYVCEFGLTDTGNVANAVKEFPREWINEDGSISYQFMKYATPLIQGEVEIPREFGLPKFISLNKNMVDKKLPAYATE